MYAFFEYVLWELRNSFGIVFFTGIATLGTIAVTYTLYRRKYKGERKFPWAKALLWLILVGYAAVVIYVTLLRSGSGYRSWNLHLFRAWREAWNNYSVKNWANVLLNVAMFFPFGVLLPLIGDCFRKWYLTIATGLVMSVLIELIQLVAGIGICDVDDLFANTLGTAIGFLPIMSILSIFNKKRGRGLKSCLIYSTWLLVIVVSIASIFTFYELKEYGNLPMASAYRNNTKNTTWFLDCKLPVVDSKLPVYRAKNRSLQDCDAFAEYMAELDDTEVDMVSYYQDFAYYMLCAGGSGSGVLLVSYHDESYEYAVAGSRHDIATVSSDRGTIEGALSKYPVFIPECAKFSVDQNNWHVFTANHIVDGTVMFDGTLRCQYLEDGTLKKIENSLLTYNYYGEVSVISPSEAYHALCNGDFYDEGYFELQSPEKVKVLSCTLGYETDTKGFYRPVYVFEVKAEDGNYSDTIIIPAM